MERGPTPLGQQILARMNERGIPSTAVLSGAAGISRTTAARLIYQDGPFDEDVLLDLAVALDVSPPDLVAWPDRVRVECP